MMGIPKMTDEKKFQQFDLFNKDNDGTITPEEIQDVLSSFALQRSDPAEDLHHQVQEIIGKYDIDGDGVLTHAGIYSVQIADELYDWLYPFFIRIHRYSRINTIIHIFKNLSKI